MTDDKLKAGDNGKPPANKLAELFERLQGACAARPRGCGRGKAGCIMTEPMLPSAVETTLADHVPHISRDCAGAPSERFIVC